MLGFHLGNGNCVSIGYNKYNGIYLVNQSFQVSHSNVVGKLPGVTIMFCEPSFLKSIGKLTSSKSYEMFVIFQFLSWR